MDQMSSDWHCSPGIAKRVCTVGQAAREQREMHPAALAQMRLGQRGRGAWLWPMDSALPQDSDHTLANTH